MTILAMLLDAFSNKFNPSELYMGVILMDIIIIIAYSTTTS